VLLPLQAPDVLVNDLTFNNLMAVLLLLLMLLLLMLLLLPLQAPDVLVNDLTLNNLLELRPATQEQVRATAQHRIYSAAAVANAAEEMEDSCSFVHLAACMPPACSMKHVPLLSCCLLQRNTPVLSLNSAAASRSLHP
jgi:hypothetical protein